MCRFQKMCRLSKTVQIIEKYTSANSRGRQTTISCASRALREQRNSAKKLTRHSETFRHEKTICSKIMKNLHISGNLHIFRGFCTFLLSFEQMDFFSQKAWELRVDTFLEISHLRRARGLQIFVLVRSRGIA